jgi:hypothetical protein
MYSLSWLFITGLNFYTLSPLISYLGVTIFEVVLSNKLTDFTSVASPFFTLFPKCTLAHFLTLLETPSSQCLHHSYALKSMTGSVQGTLLENRGELGSMICFWSLSLTLSLSLAPTIPASS